MQTSLLHCLSFQTPLDPVYYKEAENILRKEPCGILFHSPLLIDPMAHEDMQSRRSSVAPKFLSCDFETNTENKQMEHGSNSSKLFIKSDVKGGLDQEPEFAKHYPKTLKKLLKVKYGLKCLMKHTGIS